MTESTIKGLIDRALQSVRDAAAGIDEDPETIESALVALRLVETAVEAATDELMHAINVEARATR